MLFAVVASIIYAMIVGMYNLSYLGMNCEGEFKVELSLFLIALDVIVLLEILRKSLLLLKLLPCISC